MSIVAINQSKSGVPVGKHQGKTASQPIIRFRADARDRRHVSAYTLKVLHECMAKAGVTSLEIVSSYRSAEDQARVLRAEVFGTKAEGMYGAKGRSVLAAGHKAQAAAVVAQVHHVNGVMSGHSAGPRPNSDMGPIAEKAMAEEIHALEAKYGRGCCSHHQWDPARCNVFDVSPRTLHPSQGMARFIEALTAHLLVSRIGLPEGFKNTSSKHFRESKSCLHIEVPQPLKGDFPPLKQDHTLLA